MLIPNLLLVLVIFAPIVLAEISDKEFLTFLNSNRRTTANGKQIPNMHELIWDDGLAKEAAAAFHNPHSERAVFDTDLYEKLDEARNSETEDKDPKSQFDIGPLAELLIFLSNDYSQFMLPTQKKIGCAKMTVYIKSEQHTGVKCCVEPVGYPGNKNDFKEKPGSKCSAGYENKDGLCTLVPTTTTTTTTTKPTTRVSSRPSAIPTTTETSSASEFIVMTVLLFLAVFYFFTL